MVYHRGAAAVAGVGALCALWWSVSLPPLASGGQAERFAWKSGPALFVADPRWACWLFRLADAVAVTWRAAGAVAVAALLLTRLGGVTGDCLGAGIECVETGLLLAGVGWQLSGAPAWLVSLMG